MKKVLAVEYADFFAYDHVAEADGASVILALDDIRVFR